MNFLLSLITATMLLFSCQGRAQSLDTKRTVVINTVISRGNVLKLSNDIDKMVTASKAPIHIVINSPGGDVITGFMFINYMESIKAKGVEFHCYVPGIAASMAFQILIHCDKRYALSKAFLLWHGVRVQLGGGMFTSGVIVTAKSAISLANDLMALDSVIIKELLESLSIEQSLVMYHFDNETLHVASNLAQLAPNFITTKDTITGLLETLKSKTLPSAAGEPEGEFNPGEIIYIKDAQ